MSVITEKLQRILEQMETNVQIEQLKKISSLLQFQYSMWNSESPVQQKIDYSTLVKQCNDFIRAFVSYFENDTFPVNNNLKLFLSNIENFFNIKPFDKELLEILSYYMEIVLDPSVDFWTCCELVASLESIVSKLDQEIRLDFFENKCINVYKLMDILCTCGDYSFQENILKLIFKLIGGKCDAKLAYYFFPDDELLQKQMIHINESCSQLDFRTFLNAVNLKNLSVISIKAKAVYGNTIMISPPDFYDNEKEIWVDFNIKSESVSIQCALIRLSSNLPLNHMNDTMIIYKANIGSINIKSNKMQQVILLNLVNKLTMSSQYSKEFTDKCNTVKIILQKSLYQQELVNTYLPKMFGQLILGDPNQELNGLEKVKSSHIYKPLKIDVKSTTYSSKNSNDSNSLAEVNSKKIKPSVYKTLVDGKKSTTASSRNSISEKSFAAHLLKHIEEDNDGNSVSIITDNNENIHEPPTILVAGSPIKHNIQIIERPIEITKGIQNISMNDMEHQSRSLIVQYSEDQSNLLTNDTGIEILQMSVPTFHKPQELTALEEKSQAVLNCSRNIVNQSLTESDQLRSMSNVVMDSMNRIKKSLEHLDTAGIVNKDRSLVKINFPTKQYTKPSATLCAMDSISEDEEYFDAEERLHTGNVLIAENAELAENSFLTSDSITKCVLLAKQKSVNNKATDIQSIKMINNSNTKKSNLSNQVDNTKLAGIFDSSKYDENTPESIKVNDVKAPGSKIFKTQFTEQVKHTEEYLLSPKINIEKSKSKKLFKLKDENRNNTIKASKSIEMSDNETNKDITCDYIETSVAFENPKTDESYLNEGAMKHKNEVNIKIKDATQVNNTEKDAAEKTQFINTEPSEHVQKSKEENTSIEIPVTSNEILGLADDQGLKNSFCDKNLSKIYENSTTQIENCNIPKAKYDLKTISHNDISLTDMSEMLKEMKARELIAKNLEKNDSGSEWSASDVESLLIQPRRLLRSRNKISRLIEDVSDEHNRSIANMDEAEKDINRETIKMMQGKHAEADNKFKFRSHLQRDENNIKNKSLAKKSTFSKNKIDRVEMKIENKALTNKANYDHSNNVTIIDQTIGLKKVPEDKTLEDEKKNIYQNETNYPEQQSKGRVTIVKNQSSNEIEVTAERIPIDDTFKKNITRKKPKKNMKKFEIFNDEQETINKKELTVKLVDISDQIAEMTKTKSKKVKKRGFQGRKHINKNTDDSDKLSKKIKKEKNNSVQITNKKMTKKQIAKNHKPLRDISNTKCKSMGNLNTEISVLQNKEHFESKTSKISSHESNLQLEANEDREIINYITEASDQLTMFGGEINEKSTKNNGLVVISNSDDDVCLEITSKDVTKGEDVNCKGLFKPTIKTSHSTIDSVMENRDHNLATNKKSIPLLNVSHSATLNEKEENREHAFKKATAEVIEKNTFEQSVVTKHELKEGEDVGAEVRFQNANVIETEIRSQEQSYADEQNKRGGLVVESVRKQLSNIKATNYKDENMTNILDSLMDNKQNSQTIDQFDILFNKKPVNKINSGIEDKNLLPESKIMSIDEDLSVIEEDKNVDNSTKNLVTSNKTHQLTVQYINYLKGLRKKGDLSLRASQSETNVTQEKSLKRKLYNPTDLSYMNKTNASKNIQSSTKDGSDFNKLIEDMNMTSKIENRKRTFFDESPVKSKRHLDESKRGRLDPYDFNFNAKKPTSNSSIRAEELFKEIYRKLEKSRKGTKRTPLTLPKRLSNKSSRVSRNIKNVDKTPGSKFQILQDVRFGEDAGSFDDPNDINIQINAFKEKILSVFEEGAQMVQDITSKLKSAALKRFKEA